MNISSMKGFSCTDNHYHEDGNDTTNTIVIDYGLFYSFLVTNVVCAERIKAAFPSKIIVMFVCL